MTPNPLTAMLRVEEAAARHLHKAYGVPLSQARDYAANCGMIDTESITREFLEEFPEYRPDSGAVSAMLAAVNKDEDHFNATLGRTGVRFSGD